MREVELIYKDIYRQHEKLGTFRRTTPAPYNPKHKPIHKRLRGLENELHEARNDLWQEADTDELEEISDHGWVVWFCDGVYHFAVKENDECISLVDCEC